MRRWARLSGEDVEDDVEVVSSANSSGILGPRRRREERQDYAGRCALMCATPRKQDDAQPDLNARTDTERAMRGLILVSWRRQLDNCAVGAASLAAGGFIALRRAHVERARSGRVTVPTVIYVARFVQRRENRTTHNPPTLRWPILVAVGAASLAAGGFIALRRAHVERARSGRVTVPTVRCWRRWLASAWLLPLPRGLAYPVLCQNSAHLK